jgi:inner membrane protein
LDNLTHSLFGLTVARTRLGRAGRGTTVALLLASNAPDIDIVTTAGGAASYLKWHRGPTHGPLGVIALACIVALLVRGGRRLFDRENREPGASFLALWAVSIVGVLFHILMDLPTSYGTRFLSPFSWTWFSEDWMPIVDIYLLVILGTNLWLGLRAERMRRTSRTGAPRPAAFYAMVALVLMAGDYTIRATAHHMALSTAASVFGPDLPARCDDAVPAGRWIDRWPVPSALTRRDAASRHCVVDIGAIPDMISPFRWRLIAQLSNAYEAREVDLVAAGDPLPGSRTHVRYPNQWTPAVDRAAQSNIAQTFLGFSRFPAARSVIDDDGGAIVNWRDLRFVSGERERPGGFFSVTVRLDSAGTIESERLGP